MSSWAKSSSKSSQYCKQLPKSASKNLLVLLCVNLWLYLVVWNYGISCYESMCGMRARAHTHTHTRELHKLSPPAHAPPSGSHLLFTLFYVKALYRCLCLHWLQQQPQLSEIAMQHLQHSPQRRLHYLGYSNSRTFHTRLHNNTCALHRQLQHSHKDLRRTSFYR